MAFWLTSRGLSNGLLNDIMGHFDSSIFAIIAIRNNVPLLNKLSGVVERILVEPDCVNLFSRRSGVADNFAGIAAPRPAR